MNSGTQNCSNNEKMLIKTKHKFIFILFAIYLLSNLKNVTIF